MLTVILLGVVYAECGKQSHYSVIMLSVIMLNVVYTERHFAEYHFA
jgi:hypothetical protein